MLIEVGAEWVCVEQMSMLATENARLSARRLLGSIDDLTIKNAGIDRNDRQLLARHRQAPDIVHAADRANLSPSAERIHRYRRSETRRRDINRIATRFQDAIGTKAGWLRKLFGVWIDRSVFFQ